MHFNQIPCHLSGCIISCCKTGLLAFTGVSADYSTADLYLFFTGYFHWWLKSVWELRNFFCNDTNGHPDYLKFKYLCRPQTHGEEELQLQLALAMSREEADAEETKKKSDDMRLTLAIQKSKADNSEKVRQRTRLGVALTI